MRFRTWEELPAGMRVDEVRKYYDSLRRKTFSLKIKRISDLVLSAFLLLVLSPVMFVIAVLIKKDSKGPILFRQERVTQYGRIFHIYKFRTMTADAGHAGSKITLKQDARITKTGNILRRYRLDELPQLFNILTGDMTFVGTRPEIPYYVKKYRPRMRATLLLPAGVTSEASIRFKDEGELLKQALDADRVYVEQILPKKMKYNLAALMEFGIWQDVQTMVRTVAAIVKG